MGQGREICSKYTTWQGESQMKAPNASLIRQHDNFAKLFFMRFENRAYLSYSIASFD